MGRQLQGSSRGNRSIASCHRKLKNSISSYAAEVSVPREGRIIVHVSKEHLKNVIAFLKDEGFVHLAGITVLETNGAFELLYRLSVKERLISSTIG